jgi:hypothetical protein
MYRQLVGQFGRYIGHVLKNVGGIYENFHSVEEPGDVYAPAPRAKQQEAVAFLNRQLFETPLWLVDRNILNKISNPLGGDPVGQLQTGAISSLLGASRLNALLQAAGRFGDAKVYTVEDLLADTRKEIWKELNTHSPIDVYRRNLQKAYVEALIALANPAPPQSTMIAPGFTITFGVNTKNTDLTSIGKGELEELRARILSALPATSDKISRYHLKDIAERIRQALNPKG